jgi:elongation factor Tu
MTERTEGELRRDWLARLGRPVALDHAFFAVDGVYPKGEGVTVVTGELGTGRAAVGDALEAVGYAEAPVPVRVARVERPVPLVRGVEEVVEAEAGDVVGLTLEHAAGARLVKGQCLAPPGRLRTASRVEADVWAVPAYDLPGTPEEQLHLIDEVAAGRGLELFFHTRAVPARSEVPWRPELGAERRLRFALEEAVPLYPGARFGLRYGGLTFGAGFVVDSE